MRKNFKRMIGMVAAAVVCVGLIGCGNGNGKDASGAKGNKDKDAEHYVIGVCEYQANDESVARRDYFENYLGPAFNVEFIFSEPIGDTENELSFIENIVQSGADAYISFRSDDAEQLAQVCEEYGLYYAVNCNRSATVEAAFTGEYEYFSGCFGANQPQTGALFADWLNEVASDSGEEGFMITSGLAFNGVLQHYECTVAILNALQEKYDLKFEDTIENLAVTSAPLEVANDKGVNIYIYPGSLKNETWLQGVSAGLQTGKYGVLLQALPAYSQTAVVVDEVEQTFGRNIKVASMASISDSLKNAFVTKDSFGNASLDMSTVKANSIVSCLGFIMVYNELTGYGDLNRTSSGEPMEYLFDIWSVIGAEQYEEISSWDVAGKDAWIVDVDTIKQCLGLYTENLTSEEIQKVMNGLTYDSLKERMD